MRFAISYTIDRDEATGQKLLLLSVEAVPDPAIPARDAAFYAWVILIDPG
jgi:hypothetical protein